MIKVDLISSSIPSSLFSPSSSYLSVSSSPLPGPPPPSLSSFEFSVFCSISLLIHSETRCCYAPFHYPITNTITAIHRSYSTTTSTPVYYRAAWLSGQENSAWVWNLALLVCILEKQFKLYLTISLPSYKNEVNNSVRVYLNIKWLNSPVTACIKAQ